jgi:hypothetical protein
MVALDAPDTRVRRHIGAVEYLTRERYERALAFRDAPWSYSPIARLVRAIDDRKLEKRIAEHAWALREFDADTIPWYVRGPERDHLPMAELVPECVEVWERCSIQLQGICTANDIRYVHVLQPNQYDPDSKPLSSAERESAFDEEGPYRLAIEMGYPMLREAGARLTARGIAFHDLSRIFADVDETLYVDSCCHFNGEGNRILARAIADAVVAVL